MDVRRFAFSLVILLVSCTVCAQMPDKFTNLQVFPKDTTKKDLMSVMRNFSFALGVRCEHCHVESADKKMDFAADTKDEKKTARVMLKMVADINKSYITKLGKTDALEVRCVTCHHALARPQTINHLMADVIQKKDVNAAIAQYKELREKYYGTARYDFGETPLNLLGEQLMAQDKNKEAAAIMEMNVEFNKPADGWTNSVLAMAHKANGENEKAKADFQKLVEMNPDNKWAKGQLEELKAGK